MSAMNEITEILSEKSINLSRDDVNQILALSVDVPLEQSDDLGFVWEAIALIANDPLYDGDLDPIE